MVVAGDEAVTGALVGDRLVDLSWPVAGAEFRAKIILAGHAGGWKTGLHTRTTGTLGDLGVFSLNVHKHMQSGEGGIVVDACSRTSDPQVTAAGDCTAVRLPDGSLRRWAEGPLAGELVERSMLMPRAGPYSGCPR